MTCVLEQQEVRKADRQVRAAPANRPTSASLSAAEFRGIVAAVRRFLLANADRIPHDDTITHRWLTEYIVFHACQGTLAVTWSDGMVTGVAIAWQMQEWELQSAVARGRDVFAWRPNDRTGNCVYLSVVIVEAGARPGNHIMGTLARYFLTVCPEWAGLKQFAHRSRGDGPSKLVRCGNLLGKLAGCEPHGPFETMGTRGTRPSELKE